MLSGRLPYDTGVREDGGRVKEADRLLPQLLRDRGFSTGGVVSSQLLDGDSGIDRGFDFFDAEMPVGADNTPDAGLALPERDGAQSEEIAEQWLGQQRSPRVFLFLHLNEPHAPYEPPERFAGYSPYDGEIAAADDIVGTLIKYLKSHQLYDQSTIVLVADHGEGLNDHGEQEHGLLVFKEDVHVPLIVKQAAGLGAGTRVADPVQQIDLVPTILDFVRAPIPGNVRGRSLKPILDGSGGYVEPQPIYAESLYGFKTFDWKPITVTIDERGVRPTPAADPATAAAADDPARPDPIEKVAVVEAYRSALALAADHKWPRAIAALQGIAKGGDGSAEVWRQIAALAARIDRQDLIVDADDRLLELDPSDGLAALDSARAQLRLRKLIDARDRAAQALDTGTLDAPMRAQAHAVLARVALQRGLADQAREEAAQAEIADPKLPMTPYTEGRLLFEQAEFEQALPLFEQAIEAIHKAHAPAMPDLQFFAAETLARLDRYSEAEDHYKAELREFPRETRARIGLATLYHVMGQAEDAEATLDQLTKITPTAENYTQAARLLSSFGNPRGAEALRAEARKTFR
jgi:tetratricopeptide (TPR) repeat protein